MTLKNFFSKIIYIKLLIGNIIFIYFRYKPRRHTSFRLNQKIKLIIFIINIACGGFFLRTPGWMNSIGDELSTTTTKKDFIPFIMAVVNCKKIQHFSFILIFCSCRLPQLSAFHVGISIQRSEILRQYLYCRIHRL